MRRIGLVCSVLLLTLLLTTIDGYGKLAAAELDSWQAEASLPQAIAGLSVATDGQYLYASGGADGLPVYTEVYSAKINADGSIESWLATTPLPSARTGHTSIVHNNHIYAVGGYRRPFDPGGGQASVFVAPLNTTGQLGSWTNTTSLPDDRYRHATVGYGDWIYVIAGSTDFPSFVTSTIFRAEVNADGSLGDWSQIGSLPTPLHSHTAAIVGDRIFVIGGMTTHNSASVHSKVISATIFADGSLSAWEESTALPNSLQSMGASVLGNKIIVTGGLAAYPGLVTDAVLIGEVNPDGEILSWQNGPALPKPLAYHGTSAAGNSIYVVGGGGGGSGSSYSVYSSFQESSEPIEIAYFALGDSIASGHGLMDTGKPCYRSEASYPYKVKAALEAESFIVNMNHIACSGAVAKKLPKIKPTEKSLHNQVSATVAQISQLPSDMPVLVSITIGANDFDWARPSIISRMISPQRSFERWATRVTKRVEDAIAEELAALLAKPNVVVVITELYNPFNTGSYVFALQNPKKLKNCPALDCYVRTELAISQLNAAITNQWILSPEKDRIRIAQINGVFQGHEAPQLACGINSPGVGETWIQYLGDPNSNSIPRLPRWLTKQIGDYSTGDCFHPNELGARAIATEVVEDALALLER